MPWSVCRLGSWHQGSQCARTNADLLRIAFPGCLQSDPTLSGHHTKVDGAGGARAQAARAAGLTNLADREGRRLGSVLANLGKLDEAHAVTQVG